MTYPIETVVRTARAPNRDGYVWRMDLVIFGQIVARHVSTVTVFDPEVARETAADPDIARGFAEVNGMRWPMWPARGGRA